MEGLERNNRYFVLQFPTNDRVTSIKEHFPLRCILESQVASPFHFHVVGAIRGQVDMRLYGLVDMNGHGNIHTRKSNGRFTRIFHRYGIVKIDEFYHITQSVGHHERRILQYIGKVSLTQYVHVSTHFQLVYRAFEGGIHIHINLSVSGRLAVLWGVHQLVVVGLHAEVHHHLFQVREIHETIDGKRCIALGVDIELVEHHLAIHHVHHLVIETETDRKVRHRHVHRIEFQTSVQVGAHRIARHGKGSVNIARKFHHSFRDERIEHRQREMMQFKVARYVFVTKGIGLINTAHVNNFLIIVHHVSVHMMSATISRQINATHFPIAQRTLFVLEIVHPYIGTDHHLTFGIHVVYRATQPTVQIRHVRNHLPELLESDTREFHRHFLIGNGVFAIGIEMDTGTLFIKQSDIPENSSPIRQVDVVPLIQFERAIDQRRIFREELHADSSSSKGRIHA